MKKIVISCGPIPAKLDSVKIVTNIFKGGLALKTAEYLYENFTNVTILKDKSTKYENKDNINVIETDGVLDYFDWFQKNANNYDVFIMAGAVSNLMPSKPYKNKFPSHNYKVGESFDIPFEIAPRAIDIIKKANPYCCLIGYKLFDAKDDEELIKIATHVLHDSKANIIIANTPKDAKNRKIILTQDGASIPMSFDEHLKFINKTIRAEYFKTNIVNISDEEREFLEPYVAMVKYYESQYCKNHGTIAIKIEKDDFTGMVTTSRGHF